MAKSVKKDETPEKTMYVFKANVGLKKNGEPRYKQGNQYPLTDEQAANYKNKKII